LVWFGSWLVCGGASYRNIKFWPGAQRRQAGALGVNFFIFGLGCAGLPLRLQYARSGIRVLGLDIAAKIFLASQPQPDPASPRSWQPFPTPVSIRSGKSLAGFKDPAKLTP